MTGFDPLAVPLAGLNLVEASAGTGKTYNITLLVARLIAEIGLPVERILVVTFTEAATAQLRETIRGRLRRVRAALDPGGTPGDGATPDESDLALAGKLAACRAEALGRVLAALRDFDRAAVFTIHGFCRRALAENAFDSGSPLDLKLEDDGSTRYEELARDLWAELMWDADDTLAAALFDALKQPAGLQGLVRLAGEQPDLLLVGGEPVDPAARPDPLPAFRTAGELWRSAGEDVAGMLRSALAAGDLHRGSYKPHLIDQWAADLDGFFGAARPGVSVPKGLRQFSAGMLEHRANKAARLAGRIPTHPFLDAAGSLISALEDLVVFLEAEVRHARRRVFERACELIETDKRQRRVQSFADLLLDLDRALAHPRRGPRLAAELRRRYGAALIDEFQDTDRTQWRIFEQLFAGGDTPLFVIGDPKQSIYAFRGGDVFTYLAAARTAGERRHTLDTNWRSDPRMLEGINHLLTGARAPFIDGRIDYRPVAPRPGATDRLRVDGAPEPGVRVLFCERDPQAPPDRPVARSAAAERLMEAVADDLAGVLATASLAPGSEGGEGRPLRPSDVAILVPANRQADELRAFLGRRGIPGVLWNQGSVFESAEAGLFADLLAALGSPADAGAIRRLLATDLFGLDAPQLARLVEDEGAWLGWVERFRGWHDLWERHGPVHALQAVFDCDPGHGTPALARVMTCEGGERKVTNLRHLAELTHAAAVRGRLSMAGVRRWLERRRAGGGAAERDEDALELESDALAVRLITLHKSKGLEFPVVYLPFSFDDGAPPGGGGPFVYHAPDAADRACLDLGSKERDAHLELAAGEHRAERARLLYVGLTRARHQCRVVWGAIGGFGDSTLGRLLHPEGVSPVAGRLVEAGDAELLADLRDLELRSSGAVAVSVLEDLGRLFDRPEAADASGLRPRELTRPVPEARRRSSYSTLIRGAREPNDTDEPRSRAPTRPAADGDDTVPLADLPAGRRMGTCLHEVIEGIDLAAADSDAIAAVAADRLDARGFGDLAQEGWPARVGEALAAALATRLDGTPEGPLLAGLAPGTWISEMEFLLPVAASRPVTGRDVADALRAAPGRGPSPPSLDPAGGLKPIPPGWLRGIVDLVFQWQGRYWIADYKSNHLGRRYRDYAPPHLEREMERHHYHLQYHLYALAVDRLLRSRVTGYSYERHFGGVFWLFLRGMRPLPGGSPGVFAARPPEPVIRALDLLFAGGAGEEGHR